MAQTWSSSWKNATALVLYEFGGKINEDGTYISDYDDDADLPYIGKMIISMAMHTSYSCYHCITTAKR